MEITKFGFRRLALGLLATAALVPSALAGTYSVVSANWYPSTGGPTLADGGYMHFDSTYPLDMDYGINNMTSAPDGGATSVSSNPVTQGTFAWHVRYVGTGPSDVPPPTVSCQVEVSGEGGVSCGCDVFVTGYSCSTSGLINDPFFPVPNTGLSDSTMGPGISTYASSVYNGNRTTYVGAPMINVGGNVWEGDAVMTVNTQGGAMAQGAETVSHGKGVIYGVQAASSTHLDLSVAMRLTFIEGNRVQPDI